MWLGTLLATTLLTARGIELRGTAAATLLTVDADVTVDMDEDVNEDRSVTETADVDVTENMDVDVNEEAYGVLSVVCPTPTLPTSPCVRDSVHPWTVSTRGAPPPSTPFGALCGT